MPAPTAAERESEAKGVLKQKLQEQADAHLAAGGAKENFKIDAKKMGEEAGVSTQTVSSLTKGIKWPEAPLILEDASGKRVFPPLAPPAPERAVPGTLVDKLELTTDHAQNLRMILGMTSGAPGPQVSKVILAVEKEPERYSENGMELYSSLQLAGLSNQRAQIATTKWLNSVGSTQEAKLFTDNLRLLAGVKLEGEQVDPTEKMAKMMERMMTSQTQLLQMQIQQQQLETMRSSLGKKQEPEDSNRDRLDHMMDRMEEIKIMQSVFKDSAGTGPVTGSDVAYEEHTEYEEVKDKDSGQVLRVPSRTVRTPILLTRTEHKDQGSQVVGRMTDAYMVKMMADAMKGGNGNYAPGTIVELVPQMVDGKIVKDENDQPIMIQRTSYTVPMQVGAQPANTAKDNLEMVKAIAEIVKPAKSDDSATMVKYFMDAAATAQAQNNKMLQDQLTAMSQYDPLGESLDHLKELQTLGLMAGAGEENMELGKMKIELQKWQIGESNNMRRWIEEQKDTKEARKASREQMREVTTTLRSAIKDVAGPLAENFGEGLRAGMAAKAGQSQAPPQSAPTNLTEMTDSELAAEMEKATRVGRVVGDAKSRLIEEARRRGLDPGQHVTPMAEVPEQDLGR